MPERLHKLLAHAGLGSRRDCEELVAQGRVSVDGKTVTELGTQIDPRRQAIKVDGRRIEFPEPAYYLLNKPRGVVCSAGEEERESRAIDFAPKGAGRLHTVGRLDKESEGLIILTNDGELTERLTHPRHDVPKTYHVVVRGNVASEALQKLRRGVWLAEGKATVSSVFILRHVPGATTLEVELREGKNREIRRILARVGHKVIELRRVKIGPIDAKGLGVGKTRPLTEAEREVLLEAVGRGEKRSRGEPSPSLARPERGARKASAESTGTKDAAKVRRPRITKGDIEIVKPGKSRAPAAPSTAPSPREGSPRGERKKSDALRIEKGPIKIVKSKGPTPPPARRPEKRPLDAKKTGEATKADDGALAEPLFPAEPAPRARPPYVPDEDGVIVIRRPPAPTRFSEEE